MTGVAPHARHTGVGKKERDKWEERERAWSRGEKRGSRVRAASTSLTITPLNGDATSTPTVERTARVYRQCVCSVSSTRQWKFAFFFLFSSRLDALCSCSFTFLKWLKWNRLGYKRYRLDWLEKAFFLDLDRSRYCDFVVFERKIIWCEFRKFLWL